MLPASQKVIFARGSKRRRRLDASVNRMTLRRRRSILLLPTPNISLAKPSVLPVAFSKTRAGKAPLLLTAGAVQGVDGVRLGTLDVNLRITNSCSTLTAAPSPIPVHAFSNANPAPLRSPGG